MDRSRYFVILVFGALLGASIEYMKDVNPQAAKLARIARLEALMDGGKVVYQPFGRRSSIKSKTIHGEVAGLDGLPAEKTQETLTPPAKKEDDKKKKDEKKKKGDKKKKKKKTIKGKGKTSPEDDSSDEDDSDDTLDSAPPAGGAALAPKAKEDPDKLPETVEEWVALLLPSPNVDQTTKFVKLYQNGAIAAGIYYEVVAIMLEDERDKMRELGILALGSTPSTKSFTMLSDHMMVEPLPSPKAQANMYLRQYTRLEYLHFLSGSLSTGSVDSSLRAMNYIKETAQQYLKNSTPTEPTEQDNTPRAPASNVSRYFSNVAKALEYFAQNATNQSLQTEATSTLEAIRPLVGSSQVAEYNP